MQESELTVTLVGCQLKNLNFEYNNISHLIMNSVTQLLGKVTLNHDKPRKKKVPENYVSFGELESI
jgi:hypothetical protein